MLINFNDNPIWIHSILDNLVLHRAIYNPKIRAIFQALINQPDWNHALLNTHLLHLLEVNTLETATISQWRIGLRQFRYAAVAALSYLDGIKKDLINGDNEEQSKQLLTQIMHNMSVWADWALYWCVQVTGKQLAHRYGEPLDQYNQPIDLQIIAMGKLGGYELNVSSDIDLIFLARSLSGETKGVEIQGVLRRCSNNDFMQMWARELIALLSTLTENGFAFRVDMMLRPHGSAGLLVQEHAMLEDYLVTQGRMWERLAWLKARPVYTPCFETNTMHKNNHLIWKAIIEPFVYRRYLDFTVLDALRDLHGRIRRERRLIESNPYQGLDVKLSRGGIRELEFWLQGQQLIRAGRNASLRTKDTLNTLLVMSDAGVITADICTLMTQSYVFLRRTEHAVQYINDAQTHCLPIDSIERSIIAKRLGFNCVQVFDETIAYTMTSVANQFDTLFSSDLLHESSHTLRRIDSTIMCEYQAAYIQSILDTIQVWPLNDSSRLAVNAIIETCILNMFQTDIKVIQAVHYKNDFTVCLSKHSNDQQELNNLKKIDLIVQRLLAFLKTISRRKTYLDLLLTYPPVLSRVQALMVASPFAAQYLHSHPILIDELIEGRGFHCIKDQAYWDLEKQRLWHRLNQLDEEAQLHVLCESHHAWVLRILMQDKTQAMGGDLAITEVSDALSMAADLILETALCCVNQLMQGTFEVPEGLGIIAYGKLGGKELGYGSDLDIVFIYDESLAKQSLLYTPTRYVRLVQRLISWLNVQTISGRLFEIDTALRPNGQAGMVLTTLHAFTEYQLGQAAGTHAWLWEHQAISRARLCVGNNALQQLFNALRTKILCLSREDSVLKTEIMGMRERIALDKKNRVPDSFFDVKYSTGGMIDIEFAVQYVVLRYAAQYPDLCQNIGNVALLKVMGKLGLIPIDLADTVGHLYKKLREIQHRCQLQLYTRNIIELNNVYKMDILPFIKSVRLLWETLHINFLEHN